MERIYVTVRARPLSTEDAKSSPWKLSGNSIIFPNSSFKFDFGIFLFLPSKLISKFSNFFRVLIDLIFGFDFYADRVFGDDCKTKEVYETRTKDIVSAAVGGFNGILFSLSFGVGFGN